MSNVHDRYKEVARKYLPDEVVDAQVHVLVTHELADAVVDGELVKTRFKCVKCDAWLGVQNPGNTCDTCKTRPDR